MSMYCQLMLSMYCQLLNVKLCLPSLFRVCGIHCGSIRKCYLFIALSSCLRITTIFNPLHMRKSYGSWFVSLCVCVCVCDLPETFCAHVDASRWLFKL